MKYTKMAFDCGNGYLKPKSEFMEACIPHALRMLKPSEVAGLEERSRLGADRTVWEVNGQFYQIGERAMKTGAGAVLHGEARYVPEYYGVLAAIAAFHVFPESHRNVYLYGGHTPKDTIYRPDLMHAVTSVKEWVVRHDNQTKRFKFVGGAGYEETVSVYRYATISDDGRKLQAGWLRKGNCLILDFGAFTTGVGVAVDGKLDYTAGRTFVYGVLDVLDEFGELVRRNNRKLLKGANVLNAMRLREAFADPKRGYNAGGLGFIPCIEEADQAESVFARELDLIFQQYGGVAEYQTILIGGGGAAAMEATIRRTLNHPDVYLPSDNRAELQMCGVRGAWKILTVMEAENKLAAVND